jgi:hypothetical protein
MSEKECVDESGPSLEGATRFIDVKFPLARKSIICSARRYVVIWAWFGSSAVLVWTRRVVTTAEKRAALKKKKQLSDLGSLSMSGRTYKY